MDLDRLVRLFVEARERCQHREYVILGSNCVLALAPHTPIPDDMTMSIDVDAFTRADPPRIFDLAAHLGEGSAYFAREGIYLDPVSPSLPTLPDGWEGRLIKLERQGLTLLFLDPNDAAVSKYCRGEPRDQRWIRAGVSAHIVSLPMVKQRLAQTRFADDSERARAFAQLEVDFADLLS